MSKPASSLSLLTAGRFSTYCSLVRCQTLFLALLLPTIVRADSPELKWTRGPAVAPLGDVAQIQLADGLGFVGAEDTRRALESMGNRPSGSELGLVASRAENQDWFAVFTYHAVGYVKDDERDAIDADALLASIRKGTEESNVWRKEHGSPALHTVGWIEPPHYDESTHNLTWATLARDENGHDVANYNVRLLGRYGYMSVTLVDAADRLAGSKGPFGQMLGGFGYTQGKSYAEFVRGDRVAEVGLTALIAGGAGAAAMKFGLLGKLLAALAAGWKAVLAGFATLGAFLRRVFARRSAPVLAQERSADGGG